MQVNEHRWPVHKYILVSRCANFPSLLVNCRLSNRDNIPVLELTDIHPQILEQVLQFVYTDTCDLITIGSNFTLGEEGSSVARKHEDIFHLEIGDGDAEERGINGKKSAFQVVKEQSKGQKGKSGKQKGQQHQGERNPLKLMMDVARKWGVKGLVKR